jgi:hypothetical protein
MVAQASRCSPISYISWREPRELDLAHTAPDIASLALYDYYPHPEVRYWCSLVELKSQEPHHFGGTGAYISRIVAKKSMIFLTEHIKKWYPLKTEDVITSFSVYTK